MENSKRSTSQRLSEKYPLNMLAIKEDIDKEDHMRSMILDESISIGDEVDKYSSQSNSIREKARNIL